MSAPYFFWLARDFGKLLKGKRKIIGGLEGNDSEGRMIKENEGSSSSSAWVECLDGDSFDHIVFY